MDQTFRLITMNDPAPIPPNGMPRPGAPACERERRAEVRDNVSKRSHKSGCGNFEKSVSTRIQAELSYSMGQWVESPEDLWQGSSGPEMNPVEPQHRQL